MSAIYALFHLSCVLYTKSLSIIQILFPIPQVLGRPQRQWLRAALAASDAPVKLLVSGSVVLGNPTWRDARGHAENLNTSSSSSSTSAQQVDTFCSGDDLDCYAPAQVVLFLGGALKS
jgi:hypothetical protein